MSSRQIGTSGKGMTGQGKVPVEGDIGATQSESSAEPCKDPQAIFSQIRELATYLLQGTSLNDLNRRIMSRLIHGVLEATPTQETAQQFKQWFLFAVTNQNYCSPSRARPNAAFQDGVIKVSEHIRYLRSEMNTSSFGDPYKREVVIIRAGTADSFRRLAAQYITCNHNKDVEQREYTHQSFDQLLTSAQSLTSMISLDLSDYQARSFIAELITALRKNPAQSGALYLRVEGSLNSESLNLLEETLQQSKAPLHMLVEESYNPLGVADSGMRKVSLFHNKTDMLRYQLIQDAASMGFRIGLQDLVQSYFESGRLQEIVNISSKSDDAVSLGHSEELIITQGMARRELESDFGILLNTLGRVHKQLTEVSPTSDLLKDILSEVLTDTQSLQSALQAVLEGPQCSEREVTSVFHHGYYRLRTLVQYAAQLTCSCGQSSRESLQHAIGERLGGEFIATTSGMSAARLVVLHLGERVDHIYSGKHYWETDFLVENCFATNPHYPEFPEINRSKVSWVEHTLSQSEIENLVDKIVANSGTCPNGQMICLDKSISPFFYTHSFDLEHFAISLSLKATRLDSPVYLVVDTTLDPSLSPSYLFPEGVPHNVYLIMVPSHAKLHQLGFDCVTGGAIELYSHSGHRKLLGQLREQLELRLNEEHNEQDLYSLRILATTYFDAQAEGWFAKYQSYMVGKRQRNTGALVGELVRGLDNKVRPIASSMWEGIAPLEIPDPDNPQVIHRLDFSFQYDPKSCMHAYIALREGPTERYIAGAIFEEIKRRVFALAAAEGIQLGDGTSWGFPITRMDWYMHTMRIAVGLEQAGNLARLGTIVASVIKELFDYPNDFLKGVEVSSMYGVVRDGDLEKIQRLDALVPSHSLQEGIDYQSPPPGTWDYSFVVKEGDEPKAMIVAWTENHEGKVVVNLSKAATTPDARRNRYFRRMLEFIKVRARSEGIERIVLYTSASQSNIDVVRAYERCGFEGRGLRARMLENGWPLITVRMELDLDKQRTPKQFTPVPDEQYERANQTGDISVIQHDV